MSGKEENIKKQAIRMHQPIPDRIKNKPVLNPSLMLYYDAFIELQNDRNRNEKIPWTVKIKYADRYRFSETQTERLIYFLNRLDECYGNWLANKRKSHGDVA